MSNPEQEPQEFPDYRDPETELPDDQPAEPVQDPDAEPEQQ